MKGQDRGRRLSFTGRARDNAQVLAAGGNITINEVGRPARGPAGRLWNVAAAVATFTARDVELAEMTTVMRQAAGAPVVLHGMPGVGKTQLALAWIHANAGGAGVVWQVRAAERLEAVADLAQRDLGDPAAAHQLTEQMRTAQDSASPATPDERKL